MIFWDYPKFWLASRPRAFNRGAYWTNCHFGFLLGSASTVVIVSISQLSWPLYSPLTGFSCRTVAVDVAFLTEVAVCVLGVCAVRSTCRCTLWGRFITAWIYAVACIVRLPVGAVEALQGFCFQHLHLAGAERLQNVFVTVVVVGDRSTVHLDDLSIWTTSQVRRAELIHWDHRVAFAIPRARVEDVVVVVLSATVRVCHLAGVHRAGDWRDVWQGAQGRGAWVHSAIAGDPHVLSVVGRGCPATTSSHGHWRDEEEDCHHEDGGDNSSQSTSPCFDTLWCLVEVYIFAYYTNFVNIKYVNKKSPTKVIYILYKILFTTNSILQSTTKCNLIIIL